MTYDVWHINRRRCAPYVHMLLRNSCKRILRCILCSLQYSSTQVQVLYSTVVEYSSWLFTVYCTTRICTPSMTYKVWTFGRLAWTSQSGSAGAQKSDTNSSIITDHGIIQSHSSLLLQTACDVKVLEYVLLLVDREHDVGSPNHVWTVVYSKRFFMFSVSFIVPESGVSARVDMTAATINHHRSRYNHADA